jgi:hypothetical protein
VSAYETPAHERNDLARWQWRAEEAEAALKRVVELLDISEPPQSEAEESSGREAWGVVYTDQVRAAIKGA